MASTASAIGFLEATAQQLVQQLLALPSAALAAVAMLGFGIVLVLTVHSANIFSKAKFYLYCTKYFFLAKDQPSKRPHPTPKLKGTGSGKSVIRVVFVRHGESVWNSLFNKFDLGWPVRAVASAFNEVTAFVTNPHHSVIIDSPLSSRGKKQARELAAFVKSEAGQKAMPFDPTNSVVVASNLRRAMETALIGIDPRLGPNKERIIIDSNLQEGSRNADAQALATQPRAIPDYPLQGVAHSNQTILSRLFDCRCHKGNKPLKGSNVFLRMDEFVRRAFAQSSDSPVGYQLPGQPAPSSLIVVGHSLYFRNFFRSYLPSASAHVAKTKKIQNCGVVAFDLQLDNATGEVTIDESSIKALYKGFA